MASSIVSALMTGTVIALAPVTVTIPASAQMPDLTIERLLDKTSNSALDTLSKPGAFAANSAVRIGVPSPAKPIFRAAIEKMSAPNP
jgi:hypothetical protein